jgi:hypothetical protein
MNNVEFDALLQPKYTAHTVIDSSINSGNAFPYPKVEALLHRIVSAVEKHESTLFQLSQHQQQLRKDIQQMNDKFLEISQQTDVHNKRIQVIEQATCVDNNSSMTVAESVLSNRRTIVRALNIISSKVDSEELKEAMENQNSSLEKAIKEMKRDMVSNDAMQKANETMCSLVTRMDLLSDELQNKVDKTFFKVLSSEAAALQNYAEFIVSTESSIKNLDEKLAKQADTSKSFSIHLEEITNILQNVSTNDDLKEIQSIFSDLSSQVNTLKSLMDHNKASQAQEHLSIKDDIKTLFASHQTLAKHFTNKMENIHDKSGVEKIMAKYLSRDTFDNVVTKMTHEIQLKASISEFLQLEQSMARIEQDTKATKKKVELAAQFIALLENV